MKNIKFKIILFASGLMLLNSVLFSQFSNTKIYSSAVNQIEPFIVRHQTNEQILFASSYTITAIGFRSEGIYVSTNGGISWRGNDTCTGASIGSHGGDPGPIIDKDGRFILTHQGGLPQGMFANYSTDMGLSWSSNQAILTGDQDKGAPGTDDAPSSPFYGRTYLAWTRFLSPFPIWFSFTSNGGANWSSATQINNTHNGNRSYGPSVGISPTGTVYVTWASSIPNSPYTEDFLGFAKSSNGGVNWIVTENAIDCNGIRTSQLTPWLIRANSFPVIDVDKTGGSRNGWIYIVTTDKNFAPAGPSPDIVIHRSTDNGNSWSAGVRVNQDPINNGRNQFFPNVRVDEDGGVNVIYYDGRNSADSVDVYLSRSTDGAQTFTDYKVTQRRFKPKSVAGGGGNMGDNIGMTSGNGKLYPVWMANYDVEGLFQVWTSVIDYTTIGVHQIGSEIPKEFGLSQNYPNPFNPVTNIKFSIPNAEFTTIKIYDITGKIISTIVEQHLAPGNYSASWNASEMPSGIYIYRIESSDFSESRKMILVK